MDYQHLKKIIKGLFPERLLFKYELPLRKIFALALLGGNYQCTLCKSKLRQFIKLDSGDKLCPICGSLPRHRRLWALMQEAISLQGRLLHFSPSRAMWRVLKKKGSLQYITTDFEPSFFVDQRYDITAIDLENEQVDLIICYHVLEHILDDQKAMEELHRILKPGGTIFIQTPFKEGAIYEDFTITNPEERLKHFGQADHVRVYSINGLKNRLEQTGFKVLIKNFIEAPENEFGWKEKEAVLICTK